MVISADDVVSLRNQTERGRPRVAMVAYTLFGSDARVRRHVAALVDAGYDVDVFALAGSSDRAPSDPHVHVFLPCSRRYDDRGNLFTLVQYARFAAACGKLMLQRHRTAGRYAVVHVNNMPNFLVLAALPLRWLGTPVLLDIHDTMVELYQDRCPGTHQRLLIPVLRLEERLSMRAATFVLTSEHTKWARLRDNGLRENRSAVVLNLPDTGLFPRTHLPDSPGPIEDGFRLVYHGTLAHRLGVDIAVEAAHLLVERIPDLRFDIIGDGEQRAALQRRIEELDLTDRIHLSDGFVPTDRLASMLRGADLAVLPSRLGIGTSLMLPTKLLEYVQLGIPVVTVATQTIEHYFTRDQLAFVPSDDPSGLADRIVQLWRQPEERLRLARAAREFTDEHRFDAERVRYLKIVADLARTATASRR